VQFSGFIPKATETELRQMPMISLSERELDSIIKGGISAIDDEGIARFGLNESEEILLADLHHVVLPDAQRRRGGLPGRQLTTSQHMQDYAATFLKVLRATFGKARHFSATIFETTP